MKQPPLVRENRLYQADWLMRFYQFKVDEIVDDAYPDLDLEIDPKLSWALRRGWGISRSCVTGNLWVAGAMRMRILMQLQMRKISLDNESRAAGDRCPLFKMQGKGVLPWEGF